jgi:hypothetical protein
MSYHLLQFPPPPARCRAVLPVTFALLGLAVAIPAGRAADDPKPAPRVAVAKSVSAKGMILRRESPDKPWQIVDEGEVLNTGDLLLGLHGATLESKNGAVRLVFRPDLSNTTPFPIVETVIILEEAKDADLAFKLDRGRVDFSNLKKKSDAHVRVHIGKSVADLLLDEEEAAASLEIFGRWSPGVRFSKNPKPGEGPALAGLFVVLKGEVEVKCDDKQWAMKEPPGPAFIEWDNASGSPPTPEILQKLPDWAKNDDTSEVASKRKALLEEMRQSILKKGIGPTIDEMVESDNPAKRRLAVYAMGATDDLARLGAALAAAKHPDVWENGVLALRHWIGRGPGQDMKLYQAMLKEAKFTDKQASTVLQLLHSFGEDDMAQPETYEILVMYLNHEKLAIRGLAHWHLVRLVPEGKKIAYSPLDPKEKREKAVEEWKKLLPEGKLPPKPKTDK